MTRMHIIAAAELVNDVRRGLTASDVPPLFAGLAAQDQAQAMADTFCTLFRRFNPRFNRDRFIRACGLET